MAVVQPPKIVGSEAIADILGVTEWTVRDGVRGNRPPYIFGYIGKISNRHCWDLNRFLEYDGTVGCQVCGEPANVIGFCREHSRLFLRAWSRSEASRLSLIQLVAMCQWIVERWEHVGVTPPDDVWSSTCATPGCDGEANTGRLGPLCARCTREFWGRFRRWDGM